MINSHNKQYGPILQSEPRSAWPLVLVVLLLAALASSAWFSWQNYQDAGFKKASASSGCYSFKLPEKHTIGNNNTLCSITAQSFETSVTTELLHPGITKDTIQNYADQDFDVHSTPLASDSRQSTQFAGQPAYKIASTFGRRVTNRYYVYNQAPLATIAGKQYHGVLITFTSQSTVGSLVSSVEKDWKWQSLDDKALANTTQSLSNALPLENGATACFTIELPAGAKAYQLDNCEARISYGPEIIGGLQIRPLIGTYPTLNDYVANWKKIQAAYVEISSETNIKVGIYDAQKIVYRYTSTTGSSDDQIAVLLYTGSKYASKDRARGFEIYGNYRSTNGIKTSADAILENWQWK